MLNGECYNVIKALSLPIVDIKKLFVLFLKSSKAKSGSEYKCLTRLTAWQFSVNNTIACHNLMLWIYTCNRVRQNIKKTN